ncbi:hypothetical protein [Riemerella columbipharyngis]|uniref:Microcystin-dependent protein n=1 Tax=Riemerella columbipharyngis TaxID=1071918 RepID=A0A1G7G189_9FLAO|nr:hypothetical protein [Riemerella columbipharyngis]SDE81897.1 hypothetical protein SAMN05421544_1372 [Riemerella columbipharyngis]
MNKLNFNQTGGFPLSTNILDAMQASYMLFHQLGHLAGNFAIITGCETTGLHVSDGVVYINGEVLEFKGGGISVDVFIKESKEKRTFEDGSVRDVITRRYATFGRTTPDKTYKWANFKRIFPTTELKAKHEAIEQKQTDLEARLRALETKKSPIPVGLVAIWGKPASEPIPEGWQECTDLRGKFPIGCDPDYFYDDENFSGDYDPEDYELNRIGATGGERAHTLSIPEMPSHNHAKYPYNKFGSRALDTGKWTVNKVDMGNADAEYGIGAMGKSDWNNAEAKTVGENTPHNNMPPYRVIRFIEFVGLSA